MTMDIVFKNFILMMKNRGYDTSMYDSKSNITPESFNITFCNNNTTIMVFFVNDSKIGINNVKQVFESLDSAETKNGIVIYKNVITSFAKQHIENSDYKIELFSQNQLKKDIYSHVLVPKHCLLSGDEKKKILNNLKAKECNIPKMKVTDPISKYFGAQCGDMFRIDRCEQGICSTYYRICI